MPLRGSAQVGAEGISWPVHCPRRTDVGPGGGGRDTAGECDGTMLTYEYQCIRCGNRFERLQKITDEPLDTCAACGGEIRRLISGGNGVIFKGKGFYATDYHGGAGSSWGKITPLPEKPDRTD